MSDPITQAAIQARAYQLWEESGCVDGNHEEHWRRAEAERGDAAGDAMAADRKGEDISVPPGIDGEAPRPPIQTESKPQPWPTPIVDA